MGFGELGRRRFLHTVAAAAMVGVVRRGEADGRTPSGGGERREPPRPDAMEGKICLVTGATSGMGAITALELARRGATTIVAGRSAERCAARAEEIRRETGARVETAVADLGSLEQVRRMARDVAARFDRLDVLVNNAGTRLRARTLTVDGLEKTFAVNYLSHFLLTNLLLDRLRASASARIVSVSSNAHARGDLALDNLQGERHYEQDDAYARSKLALLVFTYELARRLEGSPVAANAVHPGQVATNFGDDENGFLQGWLRVRVRNLVRRSRLTPEEGARSVVYVAAAPELEGVTGRYFDEGRDAPSSPASHDEAAARALWDASSALCALPAGEGARARVVGAAG